MAAASEWIELSSRTIEIQEVIGRLVKQINSQQNTEYTAQTVYEDNGWGSLESSYLYKAILAMMKESSIWDKQTVLARLPVSAPTQPVEPTVFTDEGDEFELEAPDVITRSLNWFKSAAPEKAIREKAKEEYEQRLLALYVEHVESTGETFYPELQAILENQYDFHGDS